MQGKKIIIFSIIIVAVIIGIIAFNGNKKTNEVIETKVSEVPIITNANVVMATKEFINTDIPNEIIQEDTKEIAEPIIEEIMEEQIEKQMEDVSVSQEIEVIEKEPIKEKIEVTKDNKSETQKKLPVNIEITEQEQKETEEFDKNEEIQQEELKISEETNENNEMNVENKIEETIEQEKEEIKSIYDYPFDVQAIKQELIAYGESMGLKHITIDEDRIITPQNSSWACPIRARKDFDGKYLERALKDMVKSTPNLVVAYGGSPIEYFTIYAEENQNGEIIFYFLH